MMRLTIMLSAFLYASLVIYSERAMHPLSVEDAETMAHGLAAPAQAPHVMGESGQVFLMTADGQDLQIMAVIAPSDAAPFNADHIKMVSTPSAEWMAVEADDGFLPTLQLVEITGSSVNLRAGPSTNNPVLRAFPRGERAELIASLDNGWAQIRVVSTGTEGYMAGRFLASIE